MRQDIDKEYSARSVGTIDCFHDVLMFFLVFTIQQIPANVVQISVKRYLTKQGVEKTFLENFFFIFYDYLSLSINSKLKNLRHEKDNFIADRVLPDQRPQSRQGRRTMSK